MKALIQAQLVKAISEDRERRAKRNVEYETPDGLLIRTATSGDKGRLRRLALLDSACVPGGPLLVAEQNGELVAALPLRGGSAIADPFVRSADVVGLLELRRAQLQPAA